MYGRLPFGKALRDAMKPQGTVAVMYSACRAGLCLLALMEWADPRLITCKDSKVLYRIQVWRITVRPVDHHVATNLAQTLKERPTVKEEDDVATL